MHVVVPRETLTSALARVQGILVKSSNNLALACVLLTAKGETLTVTATDTLITSVAKYPATVIKEDSVVVDGAILFQVVRAFGADDVTITTISGGHRIRVSCGASVANLNTLGAEDFPPVQMASGKPESKFTLRGADLARVYDQIQYAVCDDGNRYGLNGIHVERVRVNEDEAMVRFCATDGSRLAWSQAPLSEGGTIKALLKRLLPKKGVAEARRSIKTADEIWTIEIADRTVTMEAADIRIIARLIDGEFPDYQQVIPDMASHKVVLERGPFSDALRRISLFATDKNHTTAFKFGSDTLVLESSNVDTGDARDDLPITMDGQPFTTGFNAGYWKDVLGATQGDLTAEMNDVLDPCVVKIKDNQDFLGVVMPMRLD